MGGHAGHGDAECGRRRVERVDLPHRRSPKPKPDPNPPNTHNARDACLDSPGDLFYDDANFALYFADEGNMRVRKIPSDCDADGIPDLVELDASDPYIKPDFPDGILECVVDTDGDGCSDSEELLTSEMFGGRRNPTNRWDFFDVNGDKVVNIPNDILAVASAFGPGDPGSPVYNENYSPARDRSPGPAPNKPNDPDHTEPWDLGPPDGTVNVPTDILGVARQFGHTCAAAP